MPFYFIPVRKLETMGTVIFEALTPEVIEDIKADNLIREVQLALKIISEEKEHSSNFSTSDLLKLVNYLVTVFKSNIKISDKKSEREIFDLVNCLLALLNWKKKGWPKDQKSFQANNKDCMIDFKGKSDRRIKC